MKHYLAAFSILLLLITAGYANTLNSPFVFDDLTNIVNNKAIHITALSVDTLLSSGLDSLLGKRPVSNVSFALNYYSDGLNVRGYHFVNILIHLLNGMLVYMFSLITYRYAGMDTPKGKSTPVINHATLIALLSASIFITHPIQTQSVTYIVQRMNSLSVFFYLTSILTYINARSSARTSTRIILFFSCFLSGILAIASKEIAATLPIIIFLYEWYFIQKQNPAWLRKHIPFIFVVAMLFVVISFIFLGTHPVDRIMNDYQYRDFTLLERLLTEGRVVIIYFSLIFLPLHSKLNLIHGIDISEGLFSPITTLFSLLFLFGMILFAIKAAKRYPLLSFSILWIFINLAIESSFIGLELIFEHRLYLPMVSIAMFTAYAFNMVFYKNNAIFLFLCLLLISYLTFNTYVRNNVWASPERLWSNVIEKNPSSFRAHYNLANYYADNNNHALAGLNYKSAINLNPRYSKAYNNYGMLLKNSGDIDQAEQHYRLAIQSYGNNHKAFYNLGILLSESGRLDESINVYRQAINIKPDYTDALYNLGNTLDKLGNSNEAIDSYIKVIHSHPTHVLAHNNLGVIYAKQGELTKALSSFQSVVSIDPTYYGAYTNIGNIYLLQDDIQNACLSFRQSLNTNMNQPSLEKNITHLCGP